MLGALFLSAQAAQTNLHFDSNGLPTTNATKIPFAAAVPVERPLHHRAKRYLLFQPNSVTKSVVGFSVPVELGDRVNWRSLSMSYNFQMQFVPLPSIIYPWTRFGIERALHERSTDDSSLDNRRRQQPPTIRNDGTLQFAYETYEDIANRRGNDGRQCLLRAICEAAQTPVEHVGVFDEMLQLFLTCVSAVIFERNRNLTVIIVCLFSFFVCVFAGQPMM